MDIKKPQLVKVEAFVHFFQSFIWMDVLQHLLIGVFLGELGLYMSQKLQLRYVFYLFL